MSATDADRPRRRRRSRRRRARSHPPAPAAAGAPATPPPAGAPPAPPVADDSRAPPLAGRAEGRPATAAELPAPESPGLEPSEPEPAAPEVELPSAAPETAFVARVLPPEPERPLPAVRRAIFFDVENTSRPEHVARVLDHLAIDPGAARTELIAVGNWRVIGADTARLLAQRGAQLVHSAPSTGVRDWSDLRIAVSAGVWLAGARPGDRLEIVTDDRAFDAVGDVAATLGVGFRRLSFRALAGTGEGEEPEAAAPARGRDSRRRRRGRRGAARAPAAAPSAPAEPTAAAAEPPAVGAHTAPHDELIHVVRQLISRNAGQPILIDTLANELKARGFRRTPGSPRLITRLRRIRELTVTGRGLIALADGGAVARAEPPAAEAAVAGAEAGEHAPAAEAARVEARAVDARAVEAPAEPAPAEAGAPAEAPAAPAKAPRRRRRSRRGARRRRRAADAPAREAAS